MSNFTRQWDSAGGVGLQNLAGSSLLLLELRPEGGFPLLNLNI